jgi:hypothetical protein
MVDRVALKTAEISEELYVSTPITEAQLETILKAALRPLGLQAVVKDDVLQITVDMEAHALNGGDMSTWVSVDNDEADKIVEKLSAPYSATINQLPLEDAIRQISADNDLPMIIKTRALEDEGLTRDIPITVNLKNISLASFFKIMLDDCDLELNISGNILEVTSHYDASENLLSRIYWLEGTGITPIAGVITVLQTSVDPPSWDVEGGLSTIEILMNQGQSRAAIVVRQSLTNHLEIDRFFEALRNDRKKAAK